MSSLVNEAPHYLKEELFQRIKEDPTVFEFLEHSALDGLWYWDLEHPEHEWMDEVFWNLFGYKAHEKKHFANEWQDMIFQEDLDQALENFHKHLADPNYPYDQIVRYRHKDGSTIWVRCRGIALRDQQGKPTRLLGAHNDITEVMRSREALKNEREKTLRHTKLASMGEMLIAISHQWRQPLNIMGGVLMNLEDAYRSDSMTPQYLEQQMGIANRQLSYLSQTITDFREFFKPAPPDHSFLVSEALESAQIVLQAQLTDQNTLLNINHASEEIELFGKKNELQQVFINLISNALDASKDNDNEPLNDNVIRIETHTKGDHAYIQCIDTGEGVPDALQDSLFKPDVSSKSNSKNMGIGLYMSKLIIETKFKGHLYLKSSEPGYTVFEIEVPVANQPLA